jgi:hypothetical protein
MKLCIAITLAALAAAGSAFAQQPPPGPGGGGPTPEMQAARQAMREACAADMKTLCDGKERRELMMCMRENSEKASQPCKDAIAKMPRRPGPPPGGH